MATPNRQPTRRISTTRSMPAPPRLPTATPAARTNLPTTTATPSTSRLSTRKPARHNPTTPRNTPSSTRNILRGTPGRIIPARKPAAEIAQSKSQSDRYKDLLTRALELDDEPVPRSRRAYARRVAREMLGPHVVGWRAAKRVTGLGAIATVGTGTGEVKPMTVMMRPVPEAWELVKKSYGELEGMMEEERMRRKEEGEAKRRERRERGEKGEKGERRGLRCVYKEGVIR